MLRRLLYFCNFISFFFNDTATTEIYTLSLHDALPILCATTVLGIAVARPDLRDPDLGAPEPELLSAAVRSEEHTSELQSRPHLVCRLLLEKKKNSPHEMLASVRRKPAEARQSLCHLVR